MSPYITFNKGIRKMRRMNKPREINIFVDFGYPTAYKGTPSGEVCL